MAMKPVELIIKARDEASSIFGTMQGKLAAIGAAIATYFGFSAFAGAVKGAADLEAKLSEVKAVSGATASEMKALRQAAEDAGASTKFTATESADALGNLTRAGLTAKDAIAALPAVLSLAQAGGIGLAEASEYVTKAVMGMGLQFTDAGRVADVLAAGANASNTSVTGLAQALSYAAPVAKSLGLSLEATVAIIGKFADAGIDASRAGTALNAILSQFSDPASKFRQELAGAGITTGNFEQALRQLAEAGPAGQRAVLAVGTEAGPALRALLNQGIGALDDLKGKLDAAGGSAAATAAVMGDNLAGAAKDLSSAWDTVKNALTTPLLPVLKDGVTQLSEALKSAVSDGTIGRFGEAIATAFQGGIQWAKAFAEQVDVGALLARLQAFASEAQQTFTTVGEYARNAGNIVQTAYGVMSAGVNTVLAVVYKLGEAFSGVASNIQSGIALLLDGLAKVTFGGISASFKQAAEEVRLSADATWAASEAFAKRAETAFVAVADGAEVARKGWTGLTEDTSAAAVQAAASAGAFETVAQTLKEVGGDATAMGQKAQAAAILQKESAESTSAAVAALKTEYEAALAAGNVQLAVEKLQAMQNALKATGDQAKRTADDMARDLDAAFQGLGVTSQAYLKTQAASAKVFYETIRASSTSTAVDIDNAWKAMAEKAIAANNGVADATIASEAAMHGLRIETDETGKSIIKAMGGGVDAARAFSREIRSSTDDVNRQRAAIEALAKTSDGFKTNKDGSASGTFTNMLPIADAFALKAKRDAGTLSASDAALAASGWKQAQNALADMQAFLKLNPSGASMEYIQSTQAIYVAARDAYQRVMAMVGAASGSQGTGPGANAQTYTVNLTINGRATAVNVASAADANALIAALRTAAANSGMTGTLL